VKEFLISMTDIQEAERYLKQDSVKEFSIDGLLKNYFYCLFSIGQLYKTQMKLYRMVVSNDLHISFMKNISDLLILKEIVRKTRFPKSIWNYILDFKENIEKHKELFREILWDMERKNGKYFREQLVKNVKGFGWKIATFFLTLCGYVDMAVIDIWALRFLRDYIGYDIPVMYDRKRTRQVDKKSYLQYEEYLRNEAKKYNLSLSLFQIIIWVKLSSWNKVDDKDQLLLFEEVN
jgi:thermostable 8-oxoguanine DNA glycosylase